MELMLKREVYEIIRAAIAVHRELGPGFLEAVYQEALAVEMSDIGVPFERERQISIGYRGVLLKKRYKVDFLCYDSIVVETKSQHTLTDIDRAQLINYLKASGLRVGVLVNFGSYPTLEWKRIIK